MALSRRDGRADGFAIAGRSGWNAGFLGVHTRGDGMHVEFMIYDMRFTILKSGIDGVSSHRRAAECAPYR